MQMLWNGIVSEALRTLNWSVVSVDREISIETRVAWRLLLKIFQKNLILIEMPGNSSSVQKSFQSQQHNINGKVHIEKLNDDKGFDETIYFFPTSR